MRKETYICMILSALFMDTSFDIQSLEGPYVKEISHQPGESDLQLSGSGSIDIHVKADCTGKVTINLLGGTGVVTVYVPYGQPIPQVMGAGNLIVVFYNPEEEEDVKDEE